MKALARDQELLLAALFFRARMQHRRRKHRAGYLIDELEGCTLSSSQILTCIASLNGMNFIEASQVPSGRTADGRPRLVTVMKLTDTGLDFVRENIVLPDINRISESISAREIGFDIDDKLESTAIDSTSWTGNGLVYIEGEVLRKIRVTSLDMQALSRKINYISDEDQIDIQSLSDALVKICEMAAPDKGIIKLILAHPKFQAYGSLIAFIATIRGALGF